MKREYSINENEWELIFHAPLTTDTTDIVNGYIGTPNPYITSRIDSEKGFFGQGSTNSQAVSFGKNLTWSLPSSFTSELLTYTELITCCTINYSYVNSHLNQFNLNKGWCLGWLRNYGGRTIYAIPANTTATVFAHVDLTKGTNTYMPTTVYNDYNDNVYTFNADNAGGDAKFNWGVNYSNGQYYTGYFKDIKILGKKSV